jgi:hypothetical protein
MAQTSWPFENIDTSETQFSMWASNIGQGVIADKGFELEPFADSTGMNVKIKSGQALVRGHYYDSTDQETLTIATADLSNPRIDVVVLRLDPTANSIVLAVVAGTPASSPTVPALTQTVGGVYEFPLAEVRVNAAVATIAPANVTDVRYLFTPWTGAPRVPESQGNAIINGAFEINQRGFTSTTDNSVYTYDRWFIPNLGGTTYTAETFSPGAAPFAGYEGTNFMRIVTSGQTDAGSVSQLSQRVESGRTFANQTVTVSFFAKAATGTPKIAVEISQSFGTGGSPSAGVNNLAGLVTLSTSWQRHSVTVQLPSIAGKTFGTSMTDNLRLNLWVSAGSDFNARTGSLGIQSNTFDIWGVQLEAGTVATPFRRNANSLQGELAACQRYYLQVATGNNLPLGIAANTSTTLGYVVITHPVEMRATPTLVQTTGSNYYTLNATAYTQFTGIDGVTTRMTELYATGSGLTLGRAGIGRTTNALASIALSSEL